jgi:hypothetical protein
MNTQCEFADKVSALRTGRASLDECVTLLDDIKLRCGVDLVCPPGDENTWAPTWTPTSVDPGILELGDQEETWTRYVEGDYYAFLSLTNLVFQTTRFSDCYHVILAKKYWFCPTARAWATVYTDWANRVGWLGRRDWSQVEFYLGNICDGYWDWANTAFTVVKKASHF